MKDFLDSVSFKLIDQNSGQPVPNIAVQMTLYAHRKNNYHLWSISDEQGIAVFTKAECLKEIGNSKAAFIMDYASTLEECLPRVSLEIVPESQIKGSIEIRRKYREFFPGFWDCAEEYIHRLEACDNSRYVPDQLFFEEPVFQQLGPITIKIKRQESGEKGT